MARWVTWCFTQCGAQKMRFLQLFSNFIIISWHKFFRKMWPGAAEAVCVSVLLSVHTHCNKKTLPEGFSLAGPINTSSKTFIFIIIMNMMVPAVSLMNMWGSSYCLGCVTAPGAAPCCSCFSPGFELLGMEQIVLPCLSQRVPRKQRPGQSGCCTYFCSIKTCLFTFASLPFPLGSSPRARGDQPWLTNTILTPCAAPIPICLFLLCLPSQVFNKSLLNIFQIFFFKQVNLGAIEIELRYANIWSGCCVLLMVENKQVLSKMEIKQSF